MRGHPKRHRNPRDYSGEKGNLLKREHGEIKRIEQTGNRRREYVFFSFPIAGSSYLFTGEVGTLRWITPKHTAVIMNLMIFETGNPCAAMGLRKNR